MELSLKNYKTALPKERVRQAGKNEVRECDETKKGSFVAYVDEGKETFDVSITLSQDQQVSDSSCDCKNSSAFCRHKTALLLHIAKGTKITQSVKAKKKSKAEALLDEAEPTDLKEWVRDLLQRNKDLELSFTHYFSAKQQQYTPAEVTNLTEEAVKAVVKTKKNIDATQLKKVVDLWESIHAPIVKAYHANVGDENAFVNFHTLVECCFAFHKSINANTNRIPKYVEGLLQQSAEAVNNLYNEDVWKTAIGYFIKSIYEKYSVRMHYVVHVKTIISISNESRRNALIDLLATLHQSNSSKQIVNGHQFTKLLFEIMEEHELINKYFSIFEPITFDNGFNAKLLRILIDNGETKTAKEYCEKQIQGNYKDEYNILYWQFLKEIYALEKDEVRQAQVLAQLVPYSYNFDDFLHIYNRISSLEERKKWRTKMFSRAQRSANNYEKAASNFIFKLLSYEMKYVKMIQSIHSTTPWSVIIEYFEPMASANKAALLSGIINKSDGFFRRDTVEEEKNHFSQLLSCLLKHFDRQFLVTAIDQSMKRKYYYSPNDFIRYVSSNLTAGHLRAI